ncbi:hypothetical protein V8E51_015529 [Hyaloscypha variabilis]
MDFDAEPTKDKQNEPLDAAFSNARSLIFDHPYPYNSGVAIPGFFVPLPSHAIIYPNTAAEQLVPGGVRARFHSTGHQDWTGHQVLRAAYSQIQEQQLSANPETDFDSTPQFETRDLFTNQGQQDWLYRATNNYPKPNEFNLPQASTIAHASHDNHLYYPGTEQQAWYSGPIARDNVPTEFDSAWQDSTTHNTFMTSFDQGNSTNLLHSSRVIESSHFSANGSYDSHLSVSPNTGASLTNDLFEASTSIYGTSSPLRESSTHLTISSSSPETSTSAASPTPSPTNATSPNSTAARHPCAQCLSTFARLGDLRRHEKIHSPERHRKYHCWEPGCNRNGRKGFTRRDKLRDHVKGVHKIDEDGGRL